MIVDNKVKLRGSLQTRNSTLCDHTEQLLILDILLTYELKDTWNSSKWAWLFKGFNFMVNLFQEVDFYTF